MKTTNWARYAIALLAAGSLFALSSASAQSTSATWDTNADGDWTDLLNWTGDTAYAGGADNTATFGNFINANRVINLNADITIGNITASDTSNNYTISGANILTLDVTTGIPVIDVTTSGRTLTISSQISGADGLQKNGAGILTLSGTNDYTGGTTINAGRLSISDDAALGNTSGGITLNGGELHVSGSPKATSRGVTLNATAGNAIALQGNANWTFNGAFAGEGGVNFVLSGNGNVSAALTSTSNTFKGALGITTGNSNMTVSIASLADSAEANGNIIFGDGGTGTATLQLHEAATTSLTLNHRSIELLGNNNRTYRIYIGNFTTNDRGITINTDLVYAGSGTKTLSFQIDNANSPGITFGGDISDGTGGGTVAITKTNNGGPLALLGDNSYTGQTQLLSGTTTVNTLANFGSNSSIGRGTDGVVVLLGFQNSTATLNYTGGTTSSDRTIQINSRNTTETGGAVINNNGTGKLTFTAATFNQTYTADSSVTRGLTLGGSNDGEIQGTIQNSSATTLTSLTKSGTGTWTLSGANTYTGNTAVNGGILTFANVASRSTSAVTAAAAGTVGLGVKTSDAAYYSAADVGDLFNTNTLTGFTLNAASGVAIDTTNAGGSFDQTVALTGSRALTKLGTGALNLSQTNTYSGATTVSAGTLHVTGALSNSAVTVGANGTIGSNGAAGTLGNGLTISAGGNLDLAGATLAANSTGILSITGGTLTLGNLTFQDLVGWDWANASVGTYELIDGTFTIDWGSTAYLDAGSAYNFGNGNAGYFQSGSLTAVIIAIPEPSAALLGGLGLLLLLRRRRCCCC